jgi:hypothetical protein
VFLRRFSQAAQLAINRRKSAKTTPVSILTGCLTFSGDYVPTPEQEIFYSSA